MRKWFRNLFFKLWYGMTEEEMDEAIRKLRVPYRRSLIRRIK
jgi:hypothetical protein